ncbi:hypothetical protein K0M31_015561, partial [Melipona bicolor]
PGFNKVAESAYGGGDSATKAAESLEDPSWRTIPSLGSKVENGKGIPPAYGRLFALLHARRPQHRKPLPN